MYATGDHSVIEVRDAMFKKGLTSVRGGRIAHSKMIEMFKNPFYIGEMHWRGLVNKGRHKPLINKQTFEQVQTVMAQHNNFACRRRKFNFILRGFVFCARCGQRYTAEHHPKKHKSYYHCNRSGDNIKCTDKYVEVWDLEEQVTNYFKTIQFSQKFIDNVVGRVEKIYKGRKGKINKEKKALYSQKPPLRKSGILPKKSYFLA